MKIHGNAALSLNKRRLLVHRVVDEDWSLTKAAEAAEVSEPTARKWVVRYRAEGELGLLDRPSAAHRVHNRTPEDRIEAIRALRRLRFTAAEIAEILGMAETTVSGILTRTGLGRLGRVGLEPPRRYERSRPGELLHVDVKKLGRIEGGMGKRITGRQRHWGPTRTDRAGVRRKTVGWEFVHVCVDDATRLAYVEVLADERARTARLPSPRGALLRPPRDRGRARAHRQWLGLRLGRPRDRLPDAWHPPPEDPALPAADQRQGRALHPHAARRVGLRGHLSQLRGAHGGAPGVAMALQLQASTRLPRPQAPGSSLTRAEQPARVLQLAPDSGPQGT